MTLTAVLLTTAIFSAPVFGQTTPATPAKPPVHHKKPVVHKETETERQVRELREKTEAEQTQINALKDQAATSSAALAAAQASAASAQAQATTAAQAAATASTSAAQDQVKVTTLQGTVDDMKATNIGLQETIIADQAKIKEEIDTPKVIHYKGVNITPVAFFAFEGVFRNRSLNSDINTPFNSIPFPSANEGHVSELNFSGRQSRLGGLFEANAGTYKLAGYFESDFLGTGTSSNNNQSNSYVFRVRQIWGQAATTGGFTITGGQLWSLVTEDGSSTNARTEKLPNTIDSQYMVGFSWTRQPELRIQQRFGDVKTGAFTAAMSVEQAQITSFNVSGGIPGLTGTQAAVVPTNFFFAGPGQNGGLYNAAGNIGAGNTASTGGITTYANNTAPDVIVKTAYDLPHAHFELGGLARFLRDFYYPVTAAGTTAAPTYTPIANSALQANTKSAGGVFGSIRVSPAKFVDVAVQAMAGTGVGRYGSAQLADATLRPDSTLEPVKNYHGMFSVETHPMSKLDVFAYYGGEYAQRTVYTTHEGDFIGYGVRQLSDVSCYALPSDPLSAGGSAGSIAATTCQSPTRYIQEGMIGLTYRVASSPTFGRLQYSMTYSYLQRNLWSGSVTGSTVPNTPTGPRALDNMIHVSMRYYIP